MGLRQIARETAERHRQAFGNVPVLEHALDVGGEYAYRIRGEAHMWRPSVVALLASALSLGVPAVSAIAHPGGLNAEGCHNNRKTGDYHCHRGGGSSSSSTARKRTYSALGSGTYYHNCSAARAAGAAPVRSGDPGYASHLDRDGDGVGCE